MSDMNLDGPSFSKAVSTLVQKMDSISLQVFCCRNPNIVDFYGVCANEEGRMLIFTELANGNLSDLIAGGQVNWQNRCTLFIHKTNCGPGGHQLRVCRSKRCK
jgi:hypothetical protein